MLVVGEQGVVKGWLVESSSVERVHSLVGGCELRKYLSLCTLPFIFAFSAFSFSSTLDSLRSSTVRYHQDISNLRYTRFFLPFFSK